jgi:hypothetical protein
MNATQSPFTRRSILAGAFCSCCFCIPLTWSFASTSAASIGNLGPEGLPSTLELGTDPMRRIAQTVWVSQLTPGLWLHTTTAVIGQGRSDRAHPGAIGQAADKRLYPGSEGLDARACARESASRPARAELIWSPHSSLRV